MRTLILALAVVLLAAPAWATVEIIVTDTDGDGPGKIAEISYDATSETDLVRAFALNITVAPYEGSTPTIDEINDYAIGDDNGGYGIFPGSFAAAPITVNPTTGNVDDWGVAGYTPVAPAGDPEALDGLGTDGVTIEMGSLYDTLAPGTTGVLCTLVCSDNCLMSVTGNAIRGNVVLETAAMVDPVLTAATDVFIGVMDTDCFPSDAAYAEQYADWVMYDKPDCWCNSAVLGVDISNSNPEMEYEAGDYQCDGDAATDKQNPLLKWRVSLSDLTMIINNWKLREKDIGTGGALDPDPCADVAHDAQNPLLKWRVSLSDLTLVINNWKLRSSGLPGDCPRTDAAMGL